MNRTILALLCCVSTAAVAQERWPLADMNRAIEQTNFLVNKGCSGTLIDAKERYVLTANHCVVAQYETVERETVGDDGVIKKEKVRRFRDGTVTQLSFVNSDTVRTVVYKVRLVAVDKNKDLALLQVLADLPDTDAARMSCENPTRGETVYTVGNPMGSLYSSVTVGIVSSTQRNYSLIGFESDEPGVNNAKQPLMQVSSGIIGGNSGGATYNARGEFVGVPVAGHSVNEVIGFAVPLAVVKEFLTDNKLGNLFGHCETK